MTQITIQSTTIMIGLVKWAVNLLGGLSGLLQRFDHPDLDTDCCGGRQGRQLDRIPRPFVQTPLGSYEGFIMKALGGSDIYAFEGIPYAEPPDRFEPSIPKVPVPDKVFLANSPGPECMQFLPFHILKPTGTEFPPVIGSEDCLTCDIYSPSLNDSNLPVVFHIHGGGFTWGKGSDYGPAYLLERDMILVNCQYRLGILGFVTTGDREYPGNLGLKDLKIALDWLYVVIPFFGGDPSKILIHGVSAGGVLAHLLVISPFGRSWGISAIISGSGNAFSPWGIETSERAAEIVQKMAILTFCPTKSGSRAMVACLKKREPKRLLNVQMLLMTTEARFTEFFGPTIEQPNPTAMLVRPPMETYSNYRHQVPDCAALFYVAENDGHHAKVAFQVFSAHKGITTQMYLNFLPELLHYSHGRSAKDRERTTDEIVRFYGGREKVLGSWDVALQIFADFLFGFPSWLAVGLHGTPSSQSYAMIYTYKSMTYGVAHRFGVNDDDIVVGHGEDEMLIFNRTDFKYLTRNTLDPDYRVLRGWQAIILSLALEKALKLPFSIEDEKQVLTIDSYEDKKRDFDVLHFGENVVITGSLKERRVAQFWWGLGIYKLQEMK